LRQLTRDCRSHNAGIISILIYSAPHPFSGQYYIAVTFYVLNIVLFCIFLLLSIARYVMYPWVGLLMLQHPVQSLFIGTFPMGLATIVNATALIAVPAYGDWAVELTFALWWIDAILSVLSCYGITFLMFNYHKASLNTMTAAWLLPIVPLVVVAASGGLVAGVVSSNRATVVLCASWAMEGTGIGLTILILSFYFHRLMLHKLPGNEVIISAFLPLGPLGQGAFGIMEMGIQARTLFDSQTTFTSVQNSGEILYVGSMLVGLILWGWGTFWLFHGVTCLMARALEGSIPFNMGVGTRMPGHAILSAHCTRQSILTHPFLSLFLPEPVVGIHLPSRLVSPVS
jgi:tellurite resistance protein TehA-like permease